MFEREEKIAFGLLIMVLSIIGASVLIISLIGTDSLATPYSSTVSEGTLVKLQGNIGKVSLTKTGDNEIITVSDVQIYAPVGDTRLKAGDSISVTGIVQNYQGKREILVKKSSDIHILP